MGETEALNALYLLDLCQELVPGFRSLVSRERLAKAAELSPHDRVRDVLLHERRPDEWQRVIEPSDPPAALLVNRERDTNLLHDASRAVSDATKLLSGATLGGVGMVTDTIGVTTNAEESLADAAENAIDLLGDGVIEVVGSMDGTADDFAEKGMVGAVGDGMADAVDMLSDFVGFTMNGIADGVKDSLDWVAADESPAVASRPMVAHKLAISVVDLFGEEQSLGLRLENRVVTKLLRPEAETVGWCLGDCILGVGSAPVNTQEELLNAIVRAKEAFKLQGTPLKFLVERLGPKK